MSGFHEFTTNLTAGDKIELQYKGFGGDGAAAQYSNLEIFQIP